MADDDSAVSALRKHIEPLISRAIHVQDIITARFKRIGKGEYGRVLKMARKPTPEEYSKTVQLTGLGIILIGLLGFAIYIIMDKGIPALLEALGMK